MAGRSRERRSRPGRTGRSPADGSGKAPSSALLRGRARWLGRLLLILFSFGLLGLVEGGLRLAGVAAPERLILRVHEGPWDVYQINSQVGRRYFTSAMERVLPKPGFRIFPVRKEPGTIRIFVLGASSAAGFPYHTHGAFSGFLEDRLHLLLPDRRVEVINCGMTAINSFAVLDFVRELRTYEPDLFIVYLGHNEYYGAQGPASTAALGRSGAALGAVRWIFNLRLARLLNRGIETLRGPDPVIQGRTVMELMTGRRGIRRGDRVDRAALSAFERNLRGIVKAAGSTPMVLCQVASNLRDLPPFDSTARPDLPSERREVLESLLRRAWNAARSADSSGALSLSAEATGIDSTHAGARYCRAWQLDRMGRYAEALREYRAAREYDGIPFRAPEEINTIIRRVAAEGNRPLLDTEDLLARNAPQAIPGNDLFFEHVHPRAAGHLLIAGALADLLYRGEMIAPRSAWHWEADRTPEEYLAVSGLTPLDHELADQRIFRLTHRWPFRDDPAATYRSERDPDVVEAARSVLDRRVDLAEAHARLGQVFYQRGDLPAALAEYRTVCKIFPVVPAHFTMAGRILLEMRRPEEASRYLAQSLALHPADREAQSLAEAARRMEQEGSGSSGR